MIIMGEPACDESGNNLGRFLRQDCTVLRIAPLLPGLLLHIHEKEIALSSVTDIGHLPAVDPVCVHDDPARPRLPKDPAEAHHRKLPGINDIPKDIAGSDARELVNISDQDQCHSVRDRLQKIIHEHDIDHRALIHDQDIALQRVFLILLIPLRRFYFQEPVNGFCFHPSGLRKAFRRASGRRCQQDLRACHAKGCDNAECGRCLSRARPSGQYQDLALHRAQNRLHLDLVILHACSSVYTLCKSGRIHMDAFRIGINGTKPLRRADLGKVKGREIDRLLRDTSGLCLIRKRNRLRDHILRMNHLIQRHGEDILLHQEELRTGFQKHLPGGIAVSLLRELVQSIEDAAPKTNIFLMVKAHPLGNGIRRLKANAPDIIRQTIGIFLYDLDAVVTVSLIDLRGMGGGDIVALQEEHDVLDLFLLLPAPFDPFHADPSDAAHLQQPIGGLFDDVQSIGAELLHDPSGKLRSDSLHQPAAQILFHAIDRRRKLLLEALHGKLPAVLRVDPPAAAKIEDASHMDIRHGTDHGHQILIRLGPAFDDRVAVFRILIRNAFHNAAQMLHDSVPPSVWSYYIIVS